MNQFELSKFVKSAIPAGIAFGLTGFLSSLLGMDRLWANVVSLAVAIVVFNYFYNKKHFK